MNEILQIITGGIGSLGFAILFNIRRWRLAAATFGGLMSWALYLLLCKFIPSEPTCYFITALACSLYAEVMARTLKSPTTAFITTALIPMVPGLGLYRAMHALAQGQTDLGGTIASHTMALIVMIALGVGLGSAIQWIRKGGQKQ